MLKKTDYYHINTLIDWNINYDVYASLCVAKYCASAVKSREKIEQFLPLYGGGLLPKYMGCWLMGEGHSWLSSPWPTNDASFASSSTLWFALYGRFNKFFCFHFCAALWPATVQNRHWAELSLSQISMRETQTITARCVDTWPGEPMPSNQQNVRIWGHPGSSDRGKLMCHRNWFMDTEEIRSHFLDSWRRQISTVCLIGTVTSKPWCIL